MSDDRPDEDARRQAEFEAAYRRFKDRLLTVAVHLAGDRASGEDVLHDVFVAYAARLRERGAVESPERYLYQSCVNRARDLAKSARRRHEEEHDDAALARAAAWNGDPAAMVEGLDEAARIDAALRALPAVQREVVTLHLHGGRRFREIAELVGAPLNTVTSRYRYALASLRKRLEAKGVTP